MLKVSLVTISFNQGQYLRDTIKSVLDQSYQNIEYILVDPGSLDNSRSIILEYKNLLYKYIFEPDNGPSDGLNKGFSYATGEILGFINSDDILLPDAIKIVTSFFDKHPSVDVVSGCGYITDNNLKKLKRVEPSNFNRFNFAYKNLQFLQQATFFRREIFARVNGFNINNSTSWDGELFLDMILNGASFDYINDDLALFRLHNTSISVSGKSQKKYLEDFERLFQKALGRKRKYYDSLICVILTVRRWIFRPKELIIRLINGPTI